MAFKFNPFTGKLDLVGAGGAAGNSFTIMQPPTGTAPTASSSTDTLTFTTSASDIVITGNSGTKTLDFKLASAGANKALSNLASVAINTDLTFGTDATNLIGGANANRPLSVQASSKIIAGWNTPATSKTGVSLNALFGNGNPGVMFYNGTAGIQFDFDGTYLAYYNSGTGGHGLKMGVSTFIFQDSNTNNILATFDTTGLYLGNAALATTATTGFPYISSGAGIPTGVPTAKTGMVPLYYDSANNNFYVYNSAWKKVGLT